MAAGRAGARIWSALHRLAERDGVSAAAVCAVAGVLGVQSLVDLVAQHPAVYVGAWVVAVMAVDRVRTVSSAVVDDPSMPPLDLETRW